MSSQTSLHLCGHMLLPSAGNTGDQFRPGLGGSCSLRCPSLALGRCGQRQLMGPGPPVTAGHRGSCVFM